MTDGPFSIPGTLTIRDLRRDPSLAPGGVRFPEVVRRFLPMTYGAALALIPENAPAAEAVALAAFQTLAFRARGLSAKTVVATWLLRTVWYAAARERSNRGLRSRPESSEGLISQKLIRRVIKLKPKEGGPLILSTLFNESPEAIGSALHIKPARAAKRASVGATRSYRAVRKLANKTGLHSSGSEMLRRIPVAPAPETETLIVDALAQWTPKAPRDSLVKSVIAAWRWLAIGRFFKRIAVTVASIIWVIVMFAAIMAFLINTGRVNMAKLFVGPGMAGLIKEFPGLGEKAKPWAALNTVPRTSAELYGMSNIWAAKITMNADQWKRVQPVNIPPVFNDNGEMALRNPKASRSGLIGAMGLDFRWSEGRFDFGGEHFESVGVRFRGNGTYLNSLYGPKQSYKVDINRVDKKKSLAGETTLNFVNTIPDFTYVKDALAEKLFRELGAVAPRTTYAYLTVDAPEEMANRPLGLYVIIEDIDANFAKDRFGTKAVPIFKPVTRHLFDDWGKEWNAYAEIYDLKTKATEAQKQHVIDFAHLVTHASDEEFAAKLPEFLDLEEYAAFVGGHVLLSSYDGYLKNGQNFYMYLDPRSNKFGFIPWDQDHSFGEFGYVDTAESREAASIWHPEAYNNHFLERVLKVEAFKKVYRKKLEEALAGPFTKENMYREIDALAAVLRPAIAAESSFRLERFETAISTNWVAGDRNGHDQSHMEGPRAPIHQIKRFVEARVQSVRDQLDGKSEGVRLRRDR